jgi:hypothetical protein
MTPLTVVMTAFNRGQYIGAAIESVLAQTWRDFTLLIVDDASTDHTREVAERYRAADPRVRVEVNSRTLGDYANRNHAAALVTTPYFKFHDSDDIMYPHCLDVMLRPLMAAPAAGLAASGHAEWAGGPCPMLLSPEACYAREFLGGGLFMLGPAGMLFRTDAFRSVGGFDDVGPQSDLAFWLKACRTLSVLLVPNDLYWYRVHPAQENQSAAARRLAPATARRVWEALSHPECPLGPEARDRARCNTAYINARRVWRLLRSGRVADALAHVRGCGLSAADWLRYLRPPRRWAGAGTPEGAADGFRPGSWGLPWRDA